VDIARVTGLLDGITEGGHALVVRGEPGIGKSELVQHAIALARDRGITVLTATGVQGETQLGFSGLHQLLWPVRDRTDELAPSSRRVLSGVLGAVDEPYPAPFKIAMAALELLCDVAAQSPVLLAIDDAQWLDRSSVDVLTFISRRVEADPIVVLAAAREGYRSPMVDAGLPELRLGPLPVAAANELLDRGPPLGTAVRRRVLREAAGNPLALIELPVTVAAAPTLTPLPLTERLERAFADRVAELPQTTQLLLLVAALHDRDDLGEVLDAARLAATQSVSVEDLQPAVDATIVELSVRSVRFRHPLMRSAVHHHSPVAQRRTVHAALAGLLAAEPERAVWHRASLESGPAEPLAAMLEHVGDQAWRRGAIAAAAVAFTRAADLSEPSQRNRRLLAAAQLAHELGRPDGARDLLRQVESNAPSPVEHARAAWIAEMVDPRPLRDAERVGGLLAAALEAGAAGDHNLQIDLVWLVAQRTWWAAPDHVARRLLVDAARTLGDVTHDDPRVFAIHAYADPFGHAGAVADQLRRTVDAPRPVAPDVARHLGPAATVAAAFDLGMPLLDAAVDSLRESGRLGFLARMLALQAMGSAWTADWLRAIPAAEESRRLADELGDTLWATAADVALSMIAGMRGDAKAAAELSASTEQIGAAMGANFVVSLAQVGPISSALADGRNAEALERARRLFDPDDLAHHPVMSTWSIAAYADAARHLDRVEEARARVERIIEAAGPTRGCWLELGLRHAAALLADDDDADARYAAALDPRLGTWPFQHAQIRLAHGQWLRRNRRTVDSRVPLREARDAFDRLGCTAWADRARRELRASGESSRRRAPDARDHLTAQELQIAHLAAAGFSNREIAQRLYLSHRTVGTHLYRIFPKLGITSRAELPTALSG
jgi:DNA-binding CsgD family transcriptional regulator